MGPQSRRAASTAAGETGNEDCVEYETDRDARLSCEQIDDGALRACMLNYAASEKFLFLPPLK